MDADDVQVADDPERGRFVVAEDAVAARLDYRIDGDRIVLLHTEVPERFRGRGIAGRLVAAAAERAERDGLTVVPRCPYTRSWLEEHPGVAERLTVDWGPAASGQST